MKDPYTISETVLRKTLPGFFLYSESPENFLASGNLKANFDSYSTTHF